MSTIFNQQYAMQPLKCRSPIYKSPESRHHRSCRCPGTNDARSSAVTMITTKVNLFPAMFSWLFIVSCNLSGPEIIQIGACDMNKSPGTSRLYRTSQKAASDSHKKGLFFILWGKLCTICCKKSEQKITTESADDTLSQMIKNPHVIPTKLFKGLN